MKKSDLKDMMVVEMRDGDRYVVVGDRLYCGTGYVPLGAFTDELEHFDRCYKSEDIVKVYGPIRYLPTTDDLDCVEHLCTLEWVREDDLDFPFNGKAVFTGECQPNDCGYTVGKMYEFVNGKTTDDDGTCRPITAPYISEHELKTFGFLKIVE